LDNITRNTPTDKQWKKIEPLLPPEKPKRGRTSKSHRLIITAILWIIRTGAPWRDLPERFGSWNTVYSRFYRWRKQGVWQKVEETVREEANEKGELDWSIHHVDSTVVRAHQHAAGARHIGPKGEVRTPKSEGLGRSCGGFSSKIHIRVEGNGKPMNRVLTPGQAHDSKSFNELLDGWRD